MTANQKSIYDECIQAIARVDMAIAKHQRSEPEDLSIPVLQEVHSELVRMAETLDSSQFQPGYSRFILDWPDDHGLVGYLVGVAAHYRYGAVAE